LSSKNNYGTGYAYNFGISLKEIIFRNQVNKDHDAEREYTNAFEPTTDVLFLLIRAIYTSHVILEFGNIPAQATVNQP
jgi:ATP/ADP translocase